MILVFHKVEKIMSQQISNHPASTNQEESEKTPLTFKRREEGQK